MEVVFKLLEVNLSEGVTGKITVLSSHDNYPAALEQKEILLEELKSIDYGDLNYLKYIIEIAPAPESEES